MKTNVKTRRLQLRYSLRGFLLVTLGFSVCLGMYLRSARLQHLAVTEIERLGGTVKYDFEVDDSLQFNPSCQSWVPAKLHSLFGTDTFHSVVTVKMTDHVERGQLVRTEGVTDDWLRCLDGCRKVRVLMLDGSRLTDRAFTQIGKLSYLEELYVRNAHKISDAGVAHSRNLRRLRHLNISDSQLGDKSAPTIANFPGLTSLAIHGSNMTDEGLRHIATIEQLDSLAIGGGSSTFTARGLAPLATLQALTSLNIQSASVSQDGVSKLCRMTGLVQIHLEDAEIPDIGRLHTALPDCRIYD